ncbi:MAG: hypothetical protein HQM07_05245 [Zetaproteobacteria bacterium]|nr:hypothetical protein [Zetaproteobacteria bacterium]
MTVLLWSLVGVVAIALIILFFMTSKGGEQGGLSEAELLQKEALQNALSQLDYSIRNMYQAITTTNKISAIEASIQAAEFVKKVDVDGLFTDKMNDRIAYCNEELFDTYTLHAKQYVSVRLERARSFEMPQDKIKAAAQAMEFVRAQMAAGQGDQQVLTNLDTRLQDYIERMSLATEHMIQGNEYEKEKHLSAAAAEFSKVLDIFQKDQINNYMMQSEMKIMEDKVRNFDAFAYQQRKQRQQL